MRQARPPASLERSLLLHARCVYVCVERRAWLRARPQEDEIAVTLLSGCRSYYAPLTLPRQERTHQRPLLTLERATQQDFTAWQDALLWFLKKVRRAAPGWRALMPLRRCPDGQEGGSAQSLSTPGRRCDESVREGPVG